MLVNGGRAEVDSGIEPQARKKKVKGFDGPIIDNIEADV